MRILSHNEKEVLKLRKSYTYRAIAKMMSLSHTRIQQIENEAYKKGLLNDSPTYPYGDLSVRATNCLIDAEPSISSIKAAKQMSDTKLLSLNNLGIVTLREIRNHK